MATGSEPEIQEIKLDPGFEPGSVGSAGRVGLSRTYRGNDIGTTRAVKGFKFMNPVGWAYTKRRFNELAIDGHLPRSLFGQCIGMGQSDEFANELFDALARKMGIVSPWVTINELRGFWEHLTDQSFEVMLQTFFDVVDKDADGRITVEDLKRMITLSASANKLSNILNQADEYAALIMEELDPCMRGYIELYDLEVLLVQSQNQSMSLSANSNNENQSMAVSANSNNLNRLLSLKLRPSYEENPVKQWYRNFTYFLNDNKKRLWVLALWLLICAALFTWKFIEYKSHAAFEVMGYCLTTAKGAAETLKFNMALILLPVCRNTITWIRSKTKLGVVFPFDDNINFHKVIALGIAIGVGLHAGVHLTCDFPRLLHATENKYKSMKPFFGENQPANYWWFVKGREGWTGIVMVVLMAIAFILAHPFFRRKKLVTKRFKKPTGHNAFWYSHHLFIIVYVLFVIHGMFLYLSKKWYKKTTWMYLVVPSILYVCEGLFRDFRSGRHNAVKVFKVAIYPGNVLALHMSKPKGFKYSSGQYIFINCSAVSSQWHPFYITSAPGDNYLSVHIRSLGHWTSQLYSVFSTVSQAAPVDQNGLLRGVQGINISRLPRLFVDGPYGAPAQDYMKYDVLLLVGLGIGATPLVSILKDVLNNIRQQKEFKEGDAETGEAKKKRKPFATQRIYFYWITREAGSFEWFKGVLNEVAKNDQEGVIEIHNYCVSVYQEGDIRSAFIFMLQSLHHAKNGVDIVSGTHVKTHFHRPDWREVYKCIAVNHSTQRVGVFYCGPSALIGELKGLAQQFSQRTSTKFDFYGGGF